MGDGTAEGGIAGERTLLVPVTEAHLPLLARWFADPGFVRHWGGRPLTRDEVAAKYIGRRRPAVESFVVLARSVPVGYVQYVPDGPDRGGIDMVLLPEAQGDGLGPDAARALVRHLHGVRGWERVTVDPEASHTRAVAAWTKAGFRPAGRRGSRLLMECPARPSAAGARRTVDGSRGGQPHGETRTENKEETLMPSTPEPELPDPVPAQSDAVTPDLPPLGPEGPDIQGAKDDRPRPAPADEEGGEPKGAEEPGGGSGAAGPGTPAPQEQTD